MPSLFIVPGGISSQLEHFSRQILHHGSEINRRTGADTFRIVAFSEETMDPPHGKLQPCPAAAGLRLSLGLAWKESNQTVSSPFAGTHRNERNSFFSFSFTHRLCRVRTCFTESSERLLFRVRERESLRTRYADTPTPSAESRMKQRPAQLNGCAHALSDILTAIVSGKRSFARERSRQDTSLKISRHLARALFYITRIIDKILFKICNHAEIFFSFS